MATDEYRVNAASFFFILPSKSCCICGNPTGFIEFAFEVRVCPIICSDILIREYAEALNRSGGYPPPKLQEII